MKTVLIVSKCSGVSKLKSNEIWYQFHFKGVYAGEVLRKVMLRSKKEFNVTKDEEYLMYVQLLSCMHGVLRGEILKLKILNECWDRS